MVNGLAFAWQEKAQKLNKQLAAMTERAEKAEADALDAEEQATHYKDLFDTAVSERDAFKAENARLMELIKQLSEAHQTGEATDSEWTEMWTGVHQIARGEKAIAAQEPQEGGE